MERAKWTKDAQQICKEIVDSCEHKKRYHAKESEDCIRKQKWLFGIRSAINFGLAGVMTVVAFISVHEIPPRSKFLTIGLGCIAAAMTNSFCNTFDYPKMIAKHKRYMDEYQALSKRAQSQQERMLVEEDLAKVRSTLNLLQMAEVDIDQRAASLD